MRRPEQSLLHPTLLGLLRLQWLNQMTLADVEIRWHQKSVDLGFLSPKVDVGPVAIELKVDSTGRAVEQAALNRYLTPSSWVATWSPPGSRLRQLAAEEGVGLLIVATGGVYPLSYPKRGRAHTDALRIELERRRNRVRDLLSAVRHTRQVA